MAKMGFSGDDRASDRGLSTFLVGLDGVEERQHALGKQRRGGGVVRRERRVGEEVFFSGVDEQFGSVGRVDERLCGLEVFGEERVGVLAVHLDGYAFRPCVPELGDWEA